jgi:Lon protease-like protein
MTNSPLPAGFHGPAKLFPLPNLVLFPNVDQGLHIFEPRYRQMTADAISSDGYIALVLLKEGWEETYDHTPEIEEVACLGRIVRHERLPDGRYNLRLRGLTRVRLLEEVPSDKKYRTAQVAAIPDVSAEDPDPLRIALAETVLARFDSSGQAHDQLRDLFHGAVPLGQLCDILSYALPVPLAVKQGLLAESRVAERVSALIQALGETPNPKSPPRPFPPGFSPN